MPLGAAATTTTTHLPLGAAATKAEAKPKKKAKRAPGAPPGRRCRPAPGSRPSSGFYGVSANAKRWQARIRYESKEHYLGTFPTKEQAAHAYDEAARKHRKDAPLNFPSTEAQVKVVATAAAPQSRKRGREEQSSN